jgi:hypothetical protein
MQEGTYVLAKMPAMLVGSSSDKYDLGATGAKGAPGPMSCTHKLALHPLLKARTRSCLVQGHDQRQQPEALDTNIESI